MSNHVNIYRLSIDSGYMESRRRSQSSARPSLEDSTRGIREYTEFDFEDSIHYDVADGVQQYKPLLSQEESFDESDIENLEQKGYKLPSEGGSIFTSFVSITKKIIYCKILTCINKLNMANSIVGAGIIGLPFAFKEAVGLTAYACIKINNFNNTFLGILDRSFAPNWCNNRCW